MTTAEPRLGLSSSTPLSEEELYLEAARRGAHYLLHVRERRVFPSAGDLFDLKQFSEPLPELGRCAQETLEMLDELGSPGTVTLGGGRYFGFVCGGTVPAARAASVLAAAWDQNAAMRVLSPIGIALEEIAIKWILELLSLPPTTGAAFVTGATMASFVCLAAARHQMLELRGWNAEELGLFGAPQFPVYVSQESHSSVLKALALLGLGRSRVVTLPADPQGRIITTDLPDIAEPSLVCLQAGNVNTGSSDDFEALCGWAHRTNSWVHVDGAFGLWAKATKKKKALVQGVERADSWATDAHKWLNSTYDCGIALVRNSGALKAAMSMNAAYLKFGDLREPAHWGPELSRRARGVEVWAAIRSLGQAGLSEMFERTCDHATAFARSLQDAGFQVLTCFAVLRSPPTGVEALSPESLTAVLQLFGYPPEVLDTRIAPAIISAGPRFLLMPLASRESLRAMQYDFQQGRRFMNHLGITTVMIVSPETAQLFHSRNAFASGGVYEDAATGAASAAFGGYLRDIGWPHGGNIEILQGEDMGSPSRIYVEVPPMSDAPIRVSGAAQFLDV